MAACDAQCLAVAGALLEGGAEILQYRHKGFWSRGRFQEAREIALLCRAAAVPFVVNDRADYTAVLNHQGIPAWLHVGQDDMSPRDARDVIGPVARLGFSTHNQDQISATAEEPVDYVAFGPVFGTTTKEHPDPATGVAALLSIRRITRLPLVAIGGITLENAAECRAAGADSVAVISALIPRPFSVSAVTEKMREWQRVY